MNIFIALLPFFALNAQAAAPLKMYASDCTPVTGLPLVHEVDSEAKAALDEWYVILQLQSDYVTTCHAIDAQMSQTGKPMDDFKLARKKYLEEFERYKKLNNPRPAKIQKLTQILKAGGESDCRAAIQNELAMIKNRETTLKNINCNK